MRRQQDQVEPVVDLINAIFHGDARHRLSLSLNGPNMLIMRGVYRASGRFARLFCDLAGPNGSANPSEACAGNVDGRTDAIRAPKGFITSAYANHHYPSPA